MLAAMHWIFRTERRPDLVLSGINHGRNVAEDVAYSGTMAVAREATLNGIPAVAFSRPRDSAAMDAPASRWLADCIARLWQGRADWADEAHWLSVNLPRRLPAALAAARIGRDKVGKHVVIHAEGADFAKIEPLSARDYCTSDGDENHLIDAGTASVTRLNWLGHGAVPASILMPGDTRAARQIA
jgi:5'-nucleotidase